MNKASLRKSGSNWTEEHIKSLHAQGFDNIPISRFFAGYVPGLEDPEHKTPERPGSQLWLGTFNEGEKPNKARYDGYIVLSKSSSSTGQSSTGKMPIVSFEAKPRKLGTGTNYHTGQPEPYSTPNFAQELAELVGQAFSCSMGRDGTRTDHDGFLINIHGSKLRVINAYFSQTYLAQVNYPVLQSKQSLIVYRLQRFNLKHPAGRDQALQAVIGLLRYLKSGDASNAHLSRHLRP